ncbi:MAG: hypothetical protein ACFFCS_00480, partial [Candidatus Hodarchaeota archaeon]
NNKNDNILIDVTPFLPEWHRPYNPDNDLSGTRKLDQYRDLRNSLIVKNYHDGWISRYKFVRDKLIPLNPYTYEVKTNDQDAFYQFDAIDGIIMDIMSGIDLCLREIGDISGAGLSVCNDIDITNLIKILSEGVAKYSHEYSSGANVTAPRCILNSKKTLTGNRILIKIRELKKIKHKEYVESVVDAIEIELLHLEGDNYSLNMKLGVYNYKLDSYGHYDRDTTGWDDDTIIWDSFTNSVLHHPIEFDFLKIPIAQGKLTDYVDFIRNYLKKCFSAKNASVSPRKKNLSVKLTGTTLKSRYPSFTKLHPILEYQTPKKLYLTTPKGTKIKFTYPIETFGAKIMKTLYFVRKHIDSLNIDYGGITTFDIHQWLGIEDTQMFGKAIRYLIKKGLLREIDVNNEITRLNYKPVREGDEDCYYSRPGFLKMLFINDNKIKYNDIAEEKKKVDTILEIKKEDIENRAKYYSKFNNTNLFLEIFPTISNSVAKMRGEKQRYERLLSHFINKEVICDKIMNEAKPSLFGKKRSNWEWFNLEVEDKGYKIIPKSVKHNSVSKTTNFQMTRPAGLAGAGRIWEGVVNWLAESPYIDGVFIEKEFDPLTKKWYMLRVYLSMINRIETLFQLDPGFWEQ